VVTLQHVRPPKAMDAGLVVNTHVWCTQHAPQSTPAFLSAQNVADWCGGQQTNCTNRKTWTENSMRLISSICLHMWIKMYVTRLFPCNARYPIQVIFLSYSTLQTFFILKSVYWIFVWEIGAARWYLIEDIKRKCGAFLWWV